MELQKKISANVFSFILNFDFKVSFEVREIVQVVEHEVRSPALPNFPDSQSSLIWVPSNTIKPD